MWKSIRTQFIDDSKLLGSAIKKIVKLLIKSDVFTNYFSSVWVGYTDY